MNARDERAHDEQHDAREEAHDARSVPAGKALPLYKGDLDDLLAFFARPSLTIAQAEELLSHVYEERPRLVERLLSWLEAAGSAERPGSALQDAVGEAYAQQVRSTTLHDVAMVLLSYLGDQAIVPRLCALVRETQASDAFKLKLISVIHDLDPEHDSEALLDHLRYPGKAMLESHRQHVQRLASPLERSFWLELMAEDMSVSARVAFTRSSAEVDDPAAVPILVCMCYDPAPEVALAAIDAVERYKDARALPALRELAEHHPDPGVRQEARKTVDRLRVRVALSPQVSPAPVEPLLASYLTTVDGLGEQAAVFVRPLPPSLDPGEEGAPEFLRLVQVTFNDQYGIEQCFGLDVRVDDLDNLLDELGAEGLAPVPVPYDQALTQLAHACEWTWRAGRLLPLSFVAWREWIRDPFLALAAGGLASEGPGADTPEWDATEPDLPALVPPELGAEISEGLRRRLYPSCHELLYQDEFVGWSLETDEVEALGERYLRLAQEQGEPLEAGVLRALLGDGVEQIVDPALRRQLGERLYRVAPLLRTLYKEEEVWQWAVVAADALQQESPHPLREHPFLLGLVGYSLQLVLDRDIDWTAAV